MLNEDGTDAVNSLSYNYPLALQSGAVNILCKYA